MSDDRENRPSASSMRRTRLCPGSVRLTRTLRAEGKIGDGETDASRTGVSRHNLIELEVDSTSLDDGNEAYTVGRAQQLLEEARIAARINGCENTVIKETRYWVYDREMNRVCSAKLDHLEIQGTTGLIADYKTLFGQHGKASESEQLGVQAVAAADSHGLDSVYVALIQPNLAKDKQLTMAYYDSALINRTRSDIIHWCKAAEAEDAPRIPGAQCENCAARGHCREGIAATLALTVQQSVEMISPAQLEAFLQRAQMAEAIIEGARDRAKRMLEADPEAFGGRLVLKPGNKKRTLKDANKVFGVLQYFNVGVDEYRAILQAPIGAVEKLACAKSAGTKDETKKALEAALAEAGCLEISQNKPSLSST